MASPDTGDPRRGRWRLVVLAFCFALVAQGCFILAVSFTRDPF